MKFIFSILIVVLSQTMLHAQKVRESKVPSAVKEAFFKQYPGKTVEQWEREESHYEAEFYVDKVETSAVYDSNGNFIESVVELKTEELPKGITDYISNNLHGKKIREAARITDATGRISYKAEVDREEYIFDTDCALVRKDQEKN
jgi:hypothetical protein